MNQKLQTLAAPRTHVVDTGDVDLLLAQIRSKRHAEDAKRLQAMIHAWVSLPWYLRVWSALTKNLEV